MNEYTPTQVAEILNVSRMAVNKWIRSGKLNARQLQNRQYVIGHDDLEAFKQNYQPRKRSSKKV